MKVIVVNPKGQKDITDLVIQATWSGSYSQVARKLELTIASSATDYYLAKTSIELGNLIKFYIDDALLFTGYAFVKSRSGKGDALEITAYDGAIYLLKNEASYNFKNISAERIAARICNDFDIPAGQFARTGINQSFIPVGETCYDIIMKAYSKAAEQNGKKYMVLMEDNKLSVIQRGDLAVDYILCDDRDITDGTYSESLEDMVNEVAIVDSKGNKTGQVSNPDWIKSFGRLHAVYEREDGVNAAVAAKTKLHGITRSGTVSAAGNIDCITGYSVGIRDSFTGLVGTFNIDADTHTWENGLYTLQLELNFDEIMDEKTYRSKNKKASKKKTVNVTLHWNL
ncbi:MAG TPA: hypothetical protein VHP38_15080 [Ruminiclostridium sp.]|nr:hypothetical protein [Ruminiclostridium sp.]